MDDLIVPFRLANSYAPHTKAAVRHGSPVLTGKRIIRIVEIALPLTVVLGSSFVMGIIDLAMVGRFGNTTIAAVALAGFLNMIFLGFLGGLAPAVQGLLARGMDQETVRSRIVTLDCALAIALPAGFLLSVISYKLYPLFFSLVTSDAEVTQVGSMFGRVLSFATVGYGINVALRGFWAAVEQTKVYMMIGLGMDLANVGVNYILIFGHLHAPALGPTGAAVGTVCAVYLGVIANVVLLIYKLRRYTLFTFTLHLDISLRIMKLAAPAAVQEIMFYAGYLVFFMLLAKVGTEELAIANVLIRMTIFLVILSMALGMASATLVSRSLGTGDVAGAAAWGWDTAKIGVITISLLGVPMLLSPRLFLSIFLDQRHTIETAVLPLQLTAATTGVISLIYIFAFTLFSVGDGNRVMLVSFGTQWLIFLPTVWLIGLHLHYGFLPIWLAHMGYGLLATVLITALWTSGRWKVYEP